MREPQGPVAPLGSMNSGRPSGNWWVPVGVNGSPLVVTFDFRRTCTFSEVDICTRSNNVGLRMETSASPEGPWILALERPVDDCPDQPFHRLPLSDQPTGRYLRLSVHGGNISWVDEVLVWGDAEVGDTSPEAYAPVVPSDNQTPGAPKRMAGAAQSARARFLAEVVARIQKAKRYPAAARSSGAEGTARIEFVLSARGKVLAVRLAASIRRILTR